MAESKMKSESLEEARDRLASMSEAERRGFEAVAEGQLNPIRESPADPGGPEQELHVLQDTLRLRPSLQDRSDEDSVKATQETVAADLAERRAARREGRKAESKRSAPRRATRKSDGEKAE